MRAEGPNCTTQHHPLTSEAAAVVKQAVTLAKNRGHSQVTPLHVASTMLSSNPIKNGNNGNVTGILRTACLSSLSHPLHCRALELCLNVALNRLPATSTVQFGDDYYGSTVGGVYPSVSNALVAAFKRAHAHQRRGSVENQANSIVTKIELDQLVVSILDDPSVSRVMKEAGFSSSQVKNNVERKVYSEKEDSETNCPSIRSEGIEYVFTNLVGARKKSFVIIGESLGTAEGIVRKVMERIESGEVPQSLRGLRTVDVSLASFEHLTKDETVRKFYEIKNHTKGRLILQVGSLQKWISHLEGITIEDTSTPSRLKPPKEQSPILHLAMEIGRLLKREGEDEYGTNIRLIGFATIRCYYESRNSSNPSLETLWGLHPLNIHRKELEIEKDRNSKLKESGNESCWLHLLPKDKEVKKGKRKSFVNELPPWLQQYKDEINVNKAYQGYDGVMEEYKNTSPISFKHPKFMSLPPSPSPSSNSDFSFDHQRHNHDWPLTNQSRRSFDFHLSNSNPNSTSSSDGIEFVTENAPKFMELNAESMKTLCCHLEAKIPSHKCVVIPKIASTVLRCRSGMLKKKGLSTILGRGTKSDTWMVFSGVDTENMQKMARELARIVFGSYSNFISLSVIEDGGTTTTISKKRPRDGNIRGHFKRFWESIRGDPHRVFVIEDVEKAESCSLTALRKFMEMGKVESLFGEEVGIRDAIVILIYQCHFGSRWSRNDGNCNLLDLNRVVEEEEEEEEEERINDKSVVIDDVGILDYVDEVIMFD